MESEYLIQQNGARIALNLAANHLTNDSARLCFSDAVSLHHKGQQADSHKRAVDSLAHSVGVFHKDYQKAAQAL